MLAAMFILMYFVKILRPHEIVVYKGRFREQRKVDVYIVLRVIISPPLY